MPDESPNGTTDQQPPGPADTSNSGMPDEMASFISDMASGLTGLDAVLEGGSDREAPGNDDDQDTADGRPADEARGTDDDLDDENDPITDDDGDDDGSTVAAGDGGDEDLTDFDEKVKAALKGLGRDVRGRLYQHFEGRAEDKVKTVQATAEQLQRERDEAAQKTAEIRSRNARFIGLETVKDADGREIPSYDEIERLLKVRGGDDVLEDKYGLSRDEAQERIEVWDERREMLEGNQDWFDTQAWGKLSYFTLQGLKRVEGLDPDALMAGIKTPDQVIDKLVLHLTTKHQAEKDALVKRYEARLKGHSLNEEALKGKAAAGSLPQLETGGRSGGGRAMTRERVERALNDPNEFEKNRDAIYAAIGL